MIFSIVDELLSWLDADDSLKLMPDPDEDDMPDNMPDDKDSGVGVGMGVGDGDASTHEDKEEEELDDFFDKVKALPVISFLYTWHRGQSHWSRYTQRRANNRQQQHDLTQSDHS